MAGKKILIVEDDKPLAKALELKLTAVGFEAKIVENGKEALAALESEKWDMVLLDLIMPVLDGFAVMEEMNKKGDKTTVLVLTNLSQDEDMDRMMKLGAKGFFVKSDMDLAEVVEKVNEYLKAPGAQQTSAPTPAPAPAATSGKPAAGAPAKAGAQNAAKPTGKPAESMAQKAQVPAPAKEQKK